MKQHFNTGNTSKQKDRIKMFFNSVSFVRTLTWNQTSQDTALTIISAANSHSISISNSLCFFPQILTDPFELRWWALYIESLRGAKHEIEICQKFWRSVCNSCGFAASIFAFRKMLNNPTEKNSLLRRKGGGVLTSIWSCLMSRHLGSHPK